MILINLNLETILGLNYTIISIKSALYILTIWFFLFNLLTSVFNPEIILRDCYNILVTNENLGNVTQFFPDFPTFGGKAKKKREKSGEKWRGK